MVSAMMLLAVLAAPHCGEIKRFAIGGDYTVMRGQYQEAKVHAGQAYERGFPLPGLRNKLLEAGHWKEAD